MRFKKKRKEENKSMLMNDKRRKMKLRKQVVCKENQKQKLCGGGQFHNFLFHSDVNKRLLTNAHIRFHLGFNEKIQPYRLLQLIALMPFS